MTVNLNSVSSTRPPGDRQWSPKTQETARLRYMLLIPAETGGSFVSSRLAGTTDSVSGKKGKCQGLERIYPGAKLRSLVSKLIVIGAGELAQNSWRYNNIKRPLHPCNFSIWKAEATWSQIWGQAGARYQGIRPWWVMSGTPYVWVHRGVRTTASLRTTLGSQHIHRKLSTICNSKAGEMETDGICWSNSSRFNRKFSFRKQSRESEENTQCWLLAKWTATKNNLREAQWDPLLLICAPQWSNLHLP